MNSLFTVSIIMSFFVDFKACERKGDMIRWDPNRKLEWKDFKAKKPDQFDGVAATSSVQLKASYKDRFPLGEVDVTCVFITNQSWVIDTSSYLLNHEQGHFNIGELHARMLRKEIFELRTRNRLTSWRIDSLFREHVTLLDKAQDNYDTETMRSLDIIAQGEWDYKIQNSLDLLKKFLYVPKK